MALNLLFFATRKLINSEMHLAFVCRGVGINVSGCGKRGHFGPDLNFEIFIRTEIIWSLICHLLRV